MIDFKKILSVFLAVLLIFAIAPVTFANIGVTLDGTPITFDVPPQMIDYRTMVPLRAIFEALGADIDWNGDTQTVTATRGGTVVIMQVGNPVITVAGNSVTLDVPPLIVDDRTLVPARAVAESFGVNVDWNQGTQTVILTTGMVQVPTPPAGNVSIDDLRNISDFWIELDGTRFTLGMTPNDFLARGLQVRNEADLDRSIGSNGVLTGFNFSLQDTIWRTVIEATLRNPDNDANSTRYTPIGNMRITNDATRFFDNIVFVNGIRLGHSTRADVEAVFGAAHNIQELSSTTVLHYYPFERSVGQRDTLAAEYRFTFDNETNVLTAVQLDFRQ